MEHNNFIYRECLKMYKKCIEIFFNYIIYDDTTTIIKFVYIKVVEIEKPISSLKTIFNLIK